MGKNKVLIVEDDVTLREALQTAFEYDGFEVLVAEDGGAGLNAALTEKPDVMLLDLMMPVMDGIEVLKQLRQDEWGKDARVIVLTASDDLGRIAEVVEYGNVDYVTKTNVTLSEIIAKVKAKL